MIMTSNDTLIDQPKKDKKGMPAPTMMEKDITIRPDAGDSQFRSYETITLCYAPPIDETSALPSTQISCDRSCI
jgi:hypothetical protein